jgi:hypothetical protein
MWLRIAGACFVLVWLFVVTDREGSNAFGHVRVAGHAIKRKG